MGLLDVFFEFIFCKVVSDYIEVGFFYVVLDLFIIDFIDSFGLGVLV